MWVLGCTSNSSSFLVREILMSSLLSSDSADLLQVGTCPLLGGQARTLAGTQSLLWTCCSFLSSLWVFLSDSCHQPSLCSGSQSIRIREVHSNSKNSFVRKMGCTLWKQWQQGQANPVRRSCPWCFLPESLSLGLCSFFICASFYTPLWSLKSLRISWTPTNFHSHVPLACSGARSASLISQSPDWVLVPWVQIISKVYQAAFIWVTCPPWFPSVLVGVRVEITGYTMLPMST